MIDYVKTPALSVLLGFEEAAVDLLPPTYLASDLSKTLVSTRHYVFRLCPTDVPHSIRASSLVSNPSGQP